MPDMAVSSPNLWLTFRREKGKYLRSAEKCTNLRFRQMNIDYAICQCLSSMKSGCRIITIYDIACQWYRNFLKRVAAGKYLSLPSGVHLVPAVGKWHLGAHVMECFPKFSLNFIKGVGQVDGEVLETLWSTTNKVAGTTRAMAKSHRAEVLDDNMYDSNWKKWMGIGEHLEGIPH